MVSNNEWLVGVSVLSREFSDSSGYNGDSIVCMVICIYIPRLSMPILIQNTTYQANSANIIYVVYTYILLL